MRHLVFSIVFACTLSITLPRAAYSQTQTNRGSEQESSVHLEFPKPDWYSEFLQLLVPSVNRERNEEYVSALNASLGIIGSNFSFSSPEFESTPSGTIEVSAEFRTSETLLSQASSAIAGTGYSVGGIACLYFGETLEEAGLEVGTGTVIYRPYIPNKVECLYEISIRS